MVIWSFRFYKERGVSIKISDLEFHERPREKAVQHGISSLSNRELLAVILRCGYKGTSVLQLADNVLNESKGLMHLYQMDFEELIKIKGISNSKALEFLAAFELGKRISYEHLLSRPFYDNPKFLAEHLNKKIGFEQQEHFHVLYLNAKNNIIHEKTVFVGTLNMSVVHPREVFKEAIQKNAAKIVVSHNHPSNDCIPSEQDILVTNTIVEVGEIMGIPLLDHLVVSHNHYFSFKEHGLMK